MSRRGTPVRLLVLALIVVASLSGCGAGSLSASQLRSAATRICSRTQRQTARIPTPSLPSQGASYLSRGLAALAGELTALRTLRPPGDLAGQYRDGLAATAGELHALDSTLKRLNAGDDPVAAIRALQRRLGALELRAQDTWRALEIPICAAT